MSTRYRAFLVLPALILVLGLATECALAAESSASEPSKPPAVIFDTDMGSDCDDAGALAVLHALADAGEVRILGVIFSSGKNRYGVGACDAINTYYGRGDLPLGQYQGTDVGDPNDSYTKRIATDTKLFGHNVVDEAPDLVSVYRSILESQPDRSVTIITVGHPHGLVHLMRDPRAAELVRKKVARWVAMGMGGWNFQQVGMSAYCAELLEKWPLDFYISPAGKKVITGHRQLPQTPENNPVREAYRLWRTALVDGRSSWDQVAVLSLVRPNLFQVEHAGRLERKPDGEVIWNRDVDNPKHHLVTPKVSIEAMARTIEELMARPPKARGATDDVGALVREAGNAQSDARRLGILQQLAGDERLDETTRADARRLADEVQRWTTDKSLPYFSRKVNPDTGYPFGIAEDSPLFPITQFYLGRMLTWRTLESGNIIRYPDVRRKWLGRAAGEFQAASEAFPENRVVRMYLGEPIPWEKDLPGAEDAPAWARLQRENLERLADVVVWWIDHRMQDDCQFGGGWGDDCEMWRWWVPVLLAFRDPKIVDAQSRFSEALMSQPHMQGGYTSRMSDVEHTAEDSTDAILPMMHLAPDDAVWQRRARRLVDLMETLWTGENQRGQLQFKSTYFTASKVDDTSRRACDTPYHVRAVQPALLLWQRTGDEEIGRLVCRWLDTWVEATARAERGKPAGIIPAAIHWPEGRIGGLGEAWWDPRNHGEPTLYEWPSAQSALCDAFLLAWHMTGNERYLEPLESMAAIRREYYKNRDRDTSTPGSRSWCAQKLSFIAPTLAKYRYLTGDNRFDDILRHDGATSLSHDADDDRSALVDRLETSAKALRVNWPGYTSEVRWTDRVLRFPVLFEPGYMFEEGVPGFSAPRPSDLYQTATGDPGRLGYLPLNAVRWLTPPRDIAALVTGSGPDRFAAELYHFGASPRSMEAELYLLAPGKYTLEVRAAQNAEGPGTAPVTFEVAGPRTRVSIELPSRRLVKMGIQAVQPR